MRHLSAKDLSGDQRKRWAKSVKNTYRKVLRDPSASEATKIQARKKLEATNGK